jgi:hypothetical protein
LKSCLNKYRVFFIIWNQSWPYALIIMSCVLEKCRLHFLWRLNSALFILPFDLCVKILLFRSAFHFTLVYSTGISIDPLFYVVLHYLIKFKKNLWLYFQIFEIYFLNRLKLPLFVIFIFFSVNLINKFYANPFPRKGLHRYNLYVLDYACFMDEIICVIDVFISSGSQSKENFMSKRLKINLNFSHVIL